MKSDIDSIDINNSGLRCIIGYLQDAIELPKVNFLEYLQEYLIPCDLYSGPILENSRLFKLIRVVIQAADTSIEFDNRRWILIARKVATVLYPENEILSQALQGIEDHRRSRNPNSPQPGRMPSASPSPGSHENNQPFDRSYSLSRQKSSVAIVFKDDNERFSGAQNTKKSLHDIRDMYLTTIKDNEIPSSHAVDLMHTCLTGIAKKYFNFFIRGVCQTVGDSFNMLSREFNSIQHQTQTREYLYSLNIDEPNLKRIALLQKLWN